MQYQIFLDVMTDKRTELQHKQFKAFAQIYVAGACNFYVTFDGQENCELNVYY